MIGRSANTIVWLAFWLLFVLHQDVWFWNDRTLVLGFVPIGLAYHVGFSVASGLLWLAMVKLAWPVHIEEWADAVDGPSGSAERGPHA